MYALPERRRLEVVFLDVEQRAQILADPLAVRDADAVVFRPARGSAALAGTSPEILCDADEDDWVPGSGRSMITRSTVPTDSRRSWTSKISSP